MPLQRKTSRAPDEDRSYNDPVDRELREFEKHLLIDKRDLDGALETLPDLFYRVSKRFADALSLADQAKSQIDEVSAEMDILVREIALRDDEKVTETMVKQKVAQMPKMRKAIQNHLDLRRNAAMWQALKESFNQRSYAVKELVALYSAGYFSDSTAAASSREHVQNRAREANELRAEALRKKRGNSDDD